MAFPIQDYRRIYHKVGGSEAAFEVSDQDTASSTYKYYGYLHSSGSWIIIRWDLSVANNISYRYAAGKSGYDTAVTGAWVTRASLTYVYFNTITENPTTL